MYYVLSLVKDLGFSKSEINPVVIKDGDDLILFDADCPNQLGDFENALMKIGYKVSDMTRIITTLMNILMIMIISPKV